MGLPHGGDAKSQLNLNSDLSLLLGSDTFRTLIPIPFLR